MKKWITVLIIILSLTCLTLFLVACDKDTTIVVDDAMYIKGNTLTGLTDNGKTLSTISVPKYVTNIGNNAFKGCANLNSVEFGDDSQLTSIEEGAFYGCESLADIKLPSTLTSIGSFAFYGCSSLTIYCEAQSEPSGWSSAWNNSNRPVVWGYKK
ncbi:MAG: leucine-rich repeat domain-containing protein [Clostridia bacterium]|nr:leucine-rich repeat domain-containing protein [Clostridia bacterium]